MSITEAYIRSRLPTDHARQVTAEYYISLLEDGPNGLVFADLGAGDGRSFDVTKGKINNFKWIGIDIADSPEVRERKRTDCEFVSYDGIHIPFPGDSFDVVYSRQVFEHVRHPEFLLKDICRVLRPNGIFIGSVSQLEPYHSLSFWNLHSMVLRSFVRMQGLSYWSSDLV